MSAEHDELLALELLGSLDDEAELARLDELDADQVALRRAQLEQAASWLALSAEPIPPPPALRDRLVAQLKGPARLACFTGRVAELFDLGRDRVAEIFRLFEGEDRWIPMFPGAAFIDLEGGPALGSATAGIVRIAPGLGFPSHTHVGEEQVFVLQGEFVDSHGARVGPGELAVMRDGSSHAFEVVSEQELLYAVVVGKIEFPDGTRLP